jgi:hypothetical protein
MPFNYNPGYGPGSTGNQLATAGAGSPALGFFSKIAGFFGKSPEERVKNLNAIAGVLQGVSKATDSIAKGGLDDQLEKLLGQSDAIISRGGGGASGNVSPIGRGMDPNMAAQMIMEMGFGGR